MLRDKSGLLFNKHLSISDAERQEECGRPLWGIMDFKESRIREANSSTTPGYPRVKGFGLHQGVAIFQGFVLTVVPNQRLQGFQQF